MEFLGEGSYFHQNVTLLENLNSVIYPVVGTPRVYGKREGRGREGGRKEGRRKTKKGNAGLAMLLGF